MKKPLPADRAEECQRLKAIFDGKKKELKLTQEKLAHRLGINQSSVSHYLNGVNPLNAPVAAAFAKSLGVPVRDFSPRLADVIESFADDFKETWSRSAKVLDAVPHEQYVLIPQLLDDNSFVPGVNDEHVGLTEGMLFRRGWLRDMGLHYPHLRILYVTDDSMAPHIAREDVVMIDTFKKILEDGKIFLIRRPDGKTSIRRVFQMIAGGWALRCDNLDKQRYPDETLSSEAADRLPVVGQIAWRGGSSR
ncbi:MULTISPECIES: LexA family transcriptional regulator [Pseudomonas]|uniref:LexA family transcriptional regulator n=1 Tax=Pseudomonas TaxID=286 RepID=UPI001E53FE04|nr:MULTISPECIES: LexA family transcriptional regulator [Pseudomonas]MCE0881086.1 LexA family transcriptional regulator [Pseudomonas putida]MDQ2484399.1 LexA family transcriptional regulator [Pseudomonas putida]